ncbi:Ger(x)C family spore germination protein [Bacillus mesophilum]|uniref:Ger(X)C family spore germination protein n=1 Tax=Bacillus mesophilum TaxID=1071718 RepID=A0A7V7UX03_9BACI|nr:Ger(x)C family spore germination protein [Bacillus mesophilum]KAB2331836.1 Ger(x)C family spore germination protein [Bacillus mesophilum]
MKKWILLLFCLNTTLFLTGCWDLREVNQVSIVSGLALDQGKDSKYRLTIELFNPTELTPQTSSGNTASIVFGINGDSIGEMMLRLNEIFSRKPIFSHMKTMFISEELATTGISELFDPMDRNREIRNDFNIIIVEEPHKAADALKITYPLQKVSTLKINTQANNFFEDWGGDPDVRLKDIIDSMVSEGREPITAMVEIIGDPKEGSKIENIQSTHPNTYIKISGIALFKGDAMIGKLPITATRDYLLIQNKLKQTSIYINCKDQQTVDIQLKDIKVGTNVAVKDNLPTYHISISAEGNINGVQCSEQLNSFATTEDFERKAEDFIKKGLLHTINELQNEYGADIFGFGELYYKSYPKQFKQLQSNWNETFVNANFEVDTTIKIRRSGLRNESYITEIHDPEVEQ